MSKKKFFNEPETTEEEVVEEVEEKEYDDETQNEYDEEIQDDTEELKVEEDSEIDIPKEEEVSKTPDIGTVNCAKLNVRSMPSITSEIYGVLSMNDTVIITGDDNPLFYKIEFDEKDGYVMKEFINI